MATIQFDYAMHGHAYGHANGSGTINMEGVDTTIQSFLWEVACAGRGFGYNECSGRGNTTCDGSGGGCGSGAGFLTAYAGYGKGRGCGIGSIYFYGD